MHPFRRILVYASLEDEAMLAVDHAASLARESGASLCVMRVLEEGGRLAAWHSQSSGADGLRGLLEQAQRGVLEERVAPLREEGIDVRVEVAWGIPWLQLVHAVLRGDHDLVVKTAEGAARGRGLFFGSTALHLIRKCPCPVWVVSSAQDRAPRRVLAAIDPTQDETRSPLARRILNLAASLAGEHAELRVASAWRPLAMHLLRKRVPPEELEEYAQSFRDLARASLEQVIADAGDPVEPENVQLLQGEARDVLTELIEREKIDLVVMGSLGRVGVAGLLIGETAETLIRSVRCAVLVVKPPGFTCPVTLPVE